MIRIGRSLCLEEIRLSGEGFEIEIVGLVRLRKHARESGFPALARPEQRRDGRPTDRRLQLLQIKVPIDHAGILTGKIGAAIRIFMQQATV